MHLTVLSSTLLWRVGSGLLLCLLAVGAALPSVAAPPDYRQVKLTPAETIALWPGEAPGDAGKLDNIGAELDTTKPGQDGPQADNYVIRTGNVTKPTITVYLPPKGKANGAAVVVCPGRGYSILAANLEGTEVCAWLNSLGVTAILLKYRVPSRPGLERHTPAYQDAQRALSLARHRAKDWNLDVKRIGILGFSAGGHLSALLSNAYETRAYPTIDAADQENCRPDFTLLIYPAYLTMSDDLTRLASEIKPTANTPPTFIAMTEDDPVHVENALVYGQALKTAKVPVELHVYAKGGHGYGLRPSENPISHWPERAAEWLKSIGIRDKG